MIKEGIFNNNLAYLKVTTHRYKAITFWISQVSQLAYSTDDVFNLEPELDSTLYPIRV